MKNHTFHGGLAHGKVRGPLTGSPGAAGPPMSAEGVQHALRVRREERDRISGDVLDLDAHTVFRLLGGSALHGETARRWADAERRAALLWALLDAYREVLDRAERIAGSRRRLGAAELAELTGLLTGPAVRLAPEARPVERRSLLASPGERLTLDGAVAAMDAAFCDVTALVADVDAVWSAVLPGLDAATAAAASARGLLRGLGDGDPELDACEREIERLRGELRGDPLGSGRGQAGAVERTAATAGRLRERAERATALRRGYGAHREALGLLVGRVAEAEEEARRTRDLVLVKIASPALPALPRLAPFLRDRLAALDGPGTGPRTGGPDPAGGARGPGGGPEASDGRSEDSDRHSEDSAGGPGGEGGGRWLARAELLAGLERDAEQALRQAERATAELRELLARRDELRGRLEAFRAKAVRLGRAEDPVLDRLHRQAYDLLRTAPCDLRRATVAVTGYRRAIEGGAP
ncbi:hypothetical protein PS9374_00297 [Planomonospora sphaerica]|uniref:Uncharacterized protein n=1 Tax=Planomonospora sphaerica TaxID=161355 RepID=A0A171B550_9ACTN|nr:hypothetical protein PS9374_00297 [Planomonospora sphaerica]